MNCDFASRSVRRRKKESRFCFPECLETQKRIAILLHGVSGDAKRNCDLASRNVWRRKNELRFGFTKCPETQKGIAVGLHWETGKPERNCDTHAMRLLNWGDKL